MKSITKTILLLVGVAAITLVLGIALSNVKVNQNKTTQSATGLESMVGKPLPDIQLKDKDGKTYTVQDLKGKNAVLFFSEGIMCYPACWDEIAALATDPRFNNADTAVYSVTTDQPQDWNKAYEQMPDLTKASMLFDQGAVASKSLGVLNMMSSMHAGTMPGHTYIVLDKEGIVRYVFDDPNMAKNGDKLAAEMSKFNTTTQN